MRALWLLRAVTLCRASSDCKVLVRHGAQRVGAFVQNRVHFFTIFRVGVIRHVGLINVIIVTYNVKDDIFKFNLWKTINKLKIPSLQPKWPVWLVESGLRSFLISFQWAPSTSTFINLNSCGSRFRQYLWAIHPKSDRYPSSDSVSIARHMWNRNRLIALSWLSIISNLYKIVEQEQKLLHPLESVWAYN